MIGLQMIWKLETVRLLSGFRFPQDTDVRKKSIRWKRWMRRFEEDTQRSLGQYWYISRGSNAEWEWMTWVTIYHDDSLFILFSSAWHVTHHFVIVVQFVRLFVTSHGHPCNYASLLISLMPVWTAWATKHNLSTKETPLSIKSNTATMNINLRTYLMRCDYDCCFIRQVFQTTCSIIKQFAFLSKRNNKSALFWFLKSVQICFSRSHPPVWMFVLSCADVPLVGDRPIYSHGVFFLTNVLLCCSAMHAYACCRFEARFAQIQIVF